MRNGSNIGVLLLLWFLVFYVLGILGFYLLLGSLMDVGDEDFVLGVYWDFDFRWNMGYGIMFLCLIFILLVKSWKIGCDYFFFVVLSFMNDGVLVFILNIRCECGVFLFDLIKFCNIFWFLGCNNVGGLVLLKDMFIYFWLNVFLVFWIFWWGSRV